MCPVDIKKPQKTKNGYEVFGLHYYNWLVRGYIKPPGASEIRLQWDVTNGRRNIDGTPSDFDLEGNFTPRTGWYSEHNSKVGVECNKIEEIYKMTLDDVMDKCNKNETFKERLIGCLYKDFLKYQEVLKNLSPVKDPIIKHPRTISPLTSPVFKQHRNKENK